MRPRAARLPAAQALGLLALAASALGQGDPGITLPPLELGLDVAASAEGEAPFLPLGRALAQVVDHPVEVRTYARGEDLVRDLEQDRLAFAVLSCPSYRALASRTRGDGSVLGALVLAAKREYRPVLLRPREPDPRAPRNALAVASADSAAGDRREWRRRRLRPLPMRGSLDALERTLAGSASWVAVPDLALHEARAQGFPLEDLEEVEQGPGIPFEAFFVSGTVPARHRPGLRTALLSTRNRSPAGVSVQWRVADAVSYWQECPP